MQHRGCVREVFGVLGCGPVSVEVGEVGCEVLGLGSGRREEMGVIGGEVLQVVRVGEGEDEFEFEREAWGGGGGGMGGGGHYLPELASVLA